MSPIFDQVAAMMAVKSLSSTHSLGDAVGLRERKIGRVIPDHEIPINQLICSLFMHQVCQVDGRRGLRGLLAVRSASNIVGGLAPTPNPVPEASGATAWTCRAATAPMDSVKVNPI